MEERKLGLVRSGHWCHSSCVGISKFDICIFLPEGGYKCEPYELHDSTAYFIFRVFQIVTQKRSRLNEKRIFSNFQAQSQSLITGHIVARCCVHYESHKKKPTACEKLQCVLPRLPLYDP